jgi:TonB family protein
LSIFADGVGHSSEGPDAKEQRIEGTVSIDMRIGTDGLVKDATVRKSVPKLDEAALAAARQWKFRPGRARGSPSKSF